MSPDEENYFKQQKIGKREIENGETSRDDQKEYSKFIDVSSNV